MLSSRNFTVLYFSFKSTINFDLILLMGIISVSGFTFIFLLVVIQLFQHHLKRLSLFHYCLCAFIKKQLTAFMGVHFCVFIDLFVYSFASTTVSVNQFCSVQSLNMSESATPWTAARQASLSITNSRSLLKLMSIQLIMPSNLLILCHPLLLLPSIFPSIRVFTSESVLRMRWPKYWSFNFSISPSNEYSGLISFRIDWFDLLAVQGTLKSLLQHHSSKASILQCSVFFIVQLSHLYMTAGETIALTKWTL